MVMLLLGSMTSPVNSLAQPAAPCAQTPRQLLLSRDDEVLLLFPGTTEILPTRLTTTQARFLTADLPFGRWPVPQEWQVERTSQPHAYLIELRNRATGEMVLSATFQRRIELAMSVVSPSGRFVAYIQANNLASEVTLMDAATAAMQTVRIPHDAPLAAYAMHAEISPDERCLAISMERSGGPGPETWLIDLASGEVSDRIAGDLVGWLP